MEETYSTLTTRARAVHQQHSQSHGVRRTLIALAGPPGSGKSTIAAEVATRLNLEIPTILAIVLPMDGFHYSRDHLTKLPNNVEAFERRGAAWTFDAEGVIKLVKRLDSTRHRRDVRILAPAFDHTEKDPFEDAISIEPEVSLVILEGNWLLYNQEPWCRISEMMDDTWFVDVDPDLAMNRVAKRHIACGIEENWEKAVKRASGNDLWNSEEVRENLVAPGIIVQSVHHGHQNPSDWS